MRFESIIYLKSHTFHYLEDNLVFRILYKVDKFLFSPKQYKIRFKQWGFWKNLSTQHASRLLELQKSRESLGKPSTFVRSGQKLEKVRIERTIRRSKARRAAVQVESKQDSSEMPITVPSVHSVPRRLLPTGIECRTPSPEPQLNLRGDSMFEYCDIFEPDLHARPSQEAYNFDVAADDQQQQDTYFEQIRIYEIATRKLSIVNLSFATPTSSGQTAGLHAFRNRNALLAVLEPAIIDKEHLCIKYLQNYAAEFLSCPNLSVFTRHYVFPVLERNGSSVETGALVRDVKNFIQRGINLLHLSPHTSELIERAASSNKSHALEEDVFAMHYEDAINPAVLNGCLVTNVPSGPFDAFNFEISEDTLVDSIGSSPATTTFSASDYGMSPPTLFDGSSPATEAEAMVPNMISTAARSQADVLDLHLCHELDLSVSLYQSGDGASAITGLRKVAASENLKTARGKVLTRLAWFCLSYIYREEAMSEQAGYCMGEAVRGSTNFCDERGEEWHEVSHLFF